MERIKKAMAKAKEYIEQLTIDSEVNQPKNIVTKTDCFFTWDNEKRSIKDKPYLFHWSYYNGGIIGYLFE